MAASIGFLLEELEGLVLEQPHSKVERELKETMVELGKFKDILQKASRQYKKDLVIHLWERSIREAVCDIEDEIDTWFNRQTWFSFNKFCGTADDDAKALEDAVKSLREKTVKPLMIKFKFEGTDADRTQTYVTRKAQKRNCFNRVLGTSTSNLREKVIRIREKTVKPLREEFQLKFSDAGMLGQEISTDALIGSLLGKLKKELLNKSSNLSGVAAHELMLLNDELSRLKAIVMAAYLQYKRDEVFKQWETDIRDVVNDAEETIKTNCIIKLPSTSESEKPAGAGIKCLFGRNVMMNKKSTAKEATIKELRGKITPLMATHHMEKFFLAAGATKTKREKSHLIVGFNEETEFFVSELTRKSPNLEIWAIMGMAGLGKTTLARKIYEISTIKMEFPVRIWLNHCENLCMRKVLLNILSKFTSVKPEESVTDDELKIQVQCYLADAKFLMVLDDISTIDVWKRIKQDLCLTDEKLGCLGKVLITTSSKEVAKKTSTQGVYNLRMRTWDQSSELLRDQVSDEIDDAPQELRGIAEEIAKCCKGLPLSIVLIGGILLAKTSWVDDNIAAIKNEWDKVWKFLKNNDSSMKSVLDSILSLIYKTLPYDLRNCFLYLGVFPEDAAIPVRKLFRLWILEGLINDNEGQRLEEVARNNLKELINRNLVMVRKTNFDGEARICHIHVLVRQLCKREAMELNFFQEISRSEQHSGIDQKIRRLCIHSNDLKYFSEKQKLPKVRSLLCFNESPMMLNDEELEHLIDSMGLLRVYDAKNIKFLKNPDKFEHQLVHLRYLNMSVAFNTLPDIITRMWNLQVLIVDTPSPVLEFEGHMLKMKQLREFKTRAAVILRKIGEGEGSNKLQTLSRLSPESCTPEVCKRAKSLLTLAIQGDISKIGDTCLGELDSLDKLKLVHDITNGEAENPVAQLCSTYPPKLKILVLSGTHLDWKKMSIFSGISTLEVLRLEANAFQGDTWEADSIGFIHLRCLDIDQADLMHWTASKEHFPELRFLYIKNCKKLTGIPSTIGEKLEVLSLEHVNVDAANCAKKIVEDEHEKGHLVRLDIAGVDKEEKMVA